MKKFYNLIAFSIIGFCTTAHAEDYLGVFGGYSFGQNISNIKGNENLNYPSAPDGSSPITSLIPDAKYSSLKLGSSGNIGIKYGHYFDQLPAFGLESEFSYSKPNFKRQNVTITSNGLRSFTGAALSTTTGPAQITEDQQPANADLYVLDFNGLYRYQGWKSFTPYIGAGPAVYFWQIKGTGLSGIIPEFGATGVDGPEVNQHPITWGADFKLGGEYNLPQNYGLGLEYRYNWSAFKVDSFRSVSDGSGDYQGQALDVTLTKHF